MSSAESSVVDPTPAPASASDADAPSAPPAKSGAALISLLMLAQHAVPAAWSTVLPLHLQDLGFTPAQIGTVYGAASIATILSPWIGGQLADRIMPAERVIVLSNLLNMLVLWLLASQTQFWSVLLLTMLSGMLWLPTFTLTTHIALAHLHIDRHRFGYIRMYGTIGWALGTMAIGYWLSQPAWIPGSQFAAVRHGMYISIGIAAIATGVCLFMPLTPVIRGGASGRIAALGAVRALADPQLRAVMLVTFLLMLTSPFVWPHCGLYLRHLGLDDARIPPLLSTGQLVEVIVFATMATLLRRIGFRTLFAIGIGFWVLRFAIWSVDSPIWLVMLSLGLHGMCYGLIIGLGQIFVDQKSAPDTRASAQAMHVVLSMGVPIWPGNMLAALVSSYCTHRYASGAELTDYGWVFVGPTIAAAACLVLFLTLFRRATPSEAPQP